MEALTLRRRIWHQLVPFAALISRRLPWKYRRAIFRLINPTFLIGVGAVCLNRDNEVLLLKHRFLNEAYPWGLPSGNLERGETPQEGICREVREETGFIIDRVIPVHVSSDLRLIEVFFLARVDGGTPNLQLDEVTEWVWCDPATVTLPMRSSHQAALREAVALIPAIAANTP